MARQLREEWDRFLRTRTRAEKAQLEAAGFDLRDPLSDTVPYTRRMDTTPGNEDLDGWDPECETAKGMRVHFFTSHLDQVEKPSDPAMDFAVSIAARVIAAFSESGLPDVRLYADCFKLAIGYPSCGSQSDVARLHGVNKANVSFHVRSIQRGLKLPRNLVANSRQKVRSRK